MAKTKELSVILLLAMVVLGGCAQQQPKRVGMVIELRPEYIEKYKAVHADSNPGVRDLLNKYHMHNFTIFLQEIDGKDMAKLDAEPRNKTWLTICDPMQKPLKGYDSWAVMEEVYRND
jgi:L-rhamnose mutarotase